jgi:hypothetical protein
MRIKYMGNADVRRLEKGEDFGGRLGEPLDRDIEWNWDNNHVIDTEDFDGVDEEFWNLLIEESDFKDVTGLKRVPTNEAQQMWRGMPKSEEVSEGRAASSSSTAAEGGTPSADAAAATTTATAPASRGTTRRQ